MEVKEFEKTRKIAAEKLKDLQRKLDAMKLHDLEEEGEIPQITDKQKIQEQISLIESNRYKLIFRAAAGGQT